MTAQDLINTGSFTTNEIRVIDYLNDHLRDYFGEEYSDQDVSDIADILTLSKPVVKGLIGSLVKKQVLNTYNTGTGFDVISFVAQEEMQYEPLTLQAYRRTEET